jgi:hypothetical protein
MRLVPATILPMIMKHGLVIAAASSLLGILIGCSSNKGTGGTSDANTGGVVNSTGGAATGGNATAGTGGLVPATGGINGTGGSTVATGGAQQGTGGVHYGTGGSINGTGGTRAGTGGAQNSTGGIQNSTGGAPGTGTRPTGGTSPTAGGTPGTGGTNSATGGKLGTGGVGPATGGKPGTGGAGTGGTTAIDPSVSAAVNACMDKLPVGSTANITAAQRATIVTAIINACSVFAPPGAQWQTWCQMFLVAAINAESTYRVDAGATGAGNNSAVGLLQLTFASIVTDFGNYGPIDAVTRIGCNFGTFSSSDSYATKGSVMLDINCNIAIGAWYYFIFASGNGGSSVVWVDQYCMGMGVAGNLHIGMASYLMGGIAAHTSLSGADFYVNEIKGWFDQCVTYSGTTHPFELPIQPDVTKYCR